MLSNSITESPFRVQKHILETSLKDAIWEHDLASVVMLINDIKNHRDTGLMVINLYQQTYLCLAVAKRNSEIIKLFLHEFEGSEDIFVALDNLNRSLIWYAAASNLPKLYEELTKFLNQEIDIKKLQNIPDKFGNTPLHVAAWFKKIRIFPVLLPDQIQNINVRNNDGNTPLHLACFNKITGYDNAFIPYGFNGLDNDDAVIIAPEIISGLINAGADILRLNHKGESAFDLICNLPAALQQQIFIQLDATKRELLLDQYYKKLLEKQTESPQEFSSLTNFYFKLAGLVSFKSLLQAHLNFNPKIILRPTYQAVISQPRRLSIIDIKPDLEHCSLNFVDATYVSYIKKKFTVYDPPKYKRKIISNDIFSQIPLYHRLLKTIGKIDDTKPNLVKEEPTLNEQLENDNKKLEVALSDVRTNIIFLQQQPPHSFFMTRLINCLFTILALLAEGSCISGILATKDKIIDSNFAFWSFIICVVGSILSPIGGLFVCLQISSKLNHTTKINPKHWQEIISRLQNEIVKPLEVLIKDKQLSDSIIQNEITELSQSITDLATTREITALITIFNKISLIIKTIKLEMNKNEIPFYSLFLAKQDINKNENSNILQIPFDEVEANETTALLDERDSHFRYV